MDTYEIEEKLEEMTDEDFVSMRTRHLVELTQDTVELRDLMKDLKELVEEQIEHIDIIEDNINKTKISVEKGNEDLCKAKKGRNGRKVLGMVLFTASIIIAISIFS